MAQTPTSPTCGDPTSGTKGKGRLTCRSAPCGFSRLWLCSFLSSECAMAIGAKSQIGGLDHEDRGKPPQIRCKCIGRIEALLSKSLRRKLSSTRSCNAFEIHAGTRHGSADAGRLRRDYCRPEVEADDFHCFPSPLKDGRRGCLSQANPVFLSSML
jgi:hypothetical protein